MYIHIYIYKRTSENGNATQRRTVVIQKKNENTFHKKQLLTSEMIRSELALALFPLANSGKSQRFA